MKTPRTKRPPNPAARALRNEEFRQRIVKAKKAAYSRKEKRKKREGQQDDLPFFNGVRILLGTRAAIDIGTKTRCAYSRDFRL